MTNNSLEEITLLDKRIAEQPIRLPENPLITELKDFGADELLAAGVDVISTGIAGHFIKGSTRMMVLPLIGPVLEKGAFLARHLYQANKIFNTTPENVRQTKRFYFIEGVKHGSTNLMKDILIHDPMYCGGVAAGLYFLPDVPPLLLSFTSYALGVMVVAGLNVINNERKFKKIKNNLSEKGFYGETYWESRFFIRTDKNQETALEALSKEFNLVLRGKSKFHDVYMQDTLPNLNGRSGKLRLRTRDRRAHEMEETRWGPDKKAIHTLQLIYSKAINNQKKNNPDQFNYFPVQKTKLCYMLDGPTFRIEDLPTTPCEIAKKFSAPKPHYRDIIFERTLCDGPELAVCTDTVQANRPYYLLELKIYKDTKLLEQAMRFVMLECPVVARQTTQSKRDLFV
jgi:hypothetical protein